MSKEKKIPAGVSFVSLQAAIQKVKQQKQLTNLERISRMLQRDDPSLSWELVEVGLERAISEGTILKVTNKGVNSYKIVAITGTGVPHGMVKQTECVDKGTDSKELFDAVIVTVDQLGSCSLKDIEKHLHNRFSETVLHNGLRKCCRKLVKLGLLVEDCFLYRRIRSTTVTTCTNKVSSDVINLEISREEKNLLVDSHNGSKVLLCIYYCVRLHFF